MTCAIQDWAAAATAALVDVAAQALGWEATVEPIEGAPYRVPFGAYVPLTSSQSVVQLGIVAERLHCEAMSRALLGMAEDEPFGSDGDVADAIGEIANMVAGSAKTRLSEQIPDIVLGLPLCVNGRIECQGAEQVTTEIKFASTRARVVLLRAHHTSKPVSRQGR